MKLTNKQLTTFRDNINELLNKDNQFSKSELREAIGFEFTQITKERK